MGQRRNGSRAAVGHALLTLEMGCPYPLWKKRGKLGKGEGIIISPKVAHVKEVGIGLRRGIVGYVSPGSYYRKKPRAGTPFR